MREPNQTTQPKAVALVRDRDGKPVLDRPLAEYPAPIREAILAQMTEEERKTYNAH